MSIKLEGWLSDLIAKDNSEVCRRLLNEIPKVRYNIEEIKSDYACYLSDDIGIIGILVYKGSKLSSEGSLYFSSHQRRDCYFNPKRADELDKELSCTIGREQVKVQSNIPGQNEVVFDCCRYIKNVSMFVHLLEEDYNRNHEN